MTDIFKCRKSGTKCCAQKSAIREAIGHKGDEILPKPTTSKTGYSPNITTWQIVNESTTLGRTNCRDFVADKGSVCRYRFSAARFV